MESSLGARGGPRGLAVAGRGGRELSPLYSRGAHFTKWRTDGGGLGAGGHPTHGFGGQPSVDADRYRHRRTGRAGADDAVSGMLFGPGRFDSASRRPPQRCYPAPPWRQAPRRPGARRISIPCGLYAWSRRQPMEELTPTWFAARYLLIPENALLGTKHGYAIVSAIKRTTEGALLVEEGALYPALYRMEAKGWIEAEWGLSSNNRRASTTVLTPDGRHRLRTEERTWNAYARGCRAPVGRFQTGARPGRAQVSGSAGTEATRKDESGPMGGGQSCPPPAIGGRSGREPAPKRRLQTTEKVTSS